MACIELSNVTRTFAAVRAVSKLSLTVADGEFLVILGPSGAGKTTTLRLIAGLERPDAGQVRMDGVDVTDFPPAARDCAFVFQQYSLYPHLSVFDNLAFPLRAPQRRVDASLVRERVEKVARMLHIESKLERRATQLSGGEMQRVAIGRALVRRPRVFLMDEPLSSLDAQLREELRDELRRVHREARATVIYVTHDHVEATTMGDRIAVLDAGVLQQVGTPLEVYRDPHSLPVARRLGSPAINVLPASWFAGRVPAGTEHVAIRPEDVQMSNEPGSEPFSVIECSLVKHQLTAERAGVEVNARVMLSAAIPPGARTSFGFPIERCLFFGADGNRLTTPAPRRAAS